MVRRLCSYSSLWMPCDATARSKVARPIFARSGRGILARRCVQTGRFSSGNHDQNDHSIDRGEQKERGLKLEDWKEKLGSLREVSRHDLAPSATITPKHRKLEFFGKLFILEHFESWIDENGEMKLRLDLTECK